MGYSSSHVFVSEKLLRLVWEELSVYRNLGNWTEVRGPLSRAKGIQRKAKGGDREARSDGTPRKCSGSCPREGREFKRLRVRSHCTNKRKEKRRGSYRCRQTLAFRRLWGEDTRQGQDSPRGGGPSNQQRDPYRQSLHFLGNKYHFIQGRSDESWQADYIYYLKKEKKGQWEGGWGKRRKSMNTHLKKSNKDHKTYYEFPISNAKTSPLGFQFIVRFW